MTLISWTEIIYKNWKVHVRQRLNQFYQGFLCILFFTLWHKLPWSWLVSILCLWYLPVFDWYWSQWNYLTSVKNVIMWLDVILSKELVLCTKGFRRQMSDCLVWWLPQCLFTLINSTMENHGTSSPNSACDFPCSLFPLMLVLPSSRTCPYRKYWFLDNYMCHASDTHDSLSYLALSFPLQKSSIGTDTAVHLICMSSMQSKWTAGISFWKFCNLTLNVISLISYVF